MAAGWRGRGGLAGNLVGAGPAATFAFAPQLTVTWPPSIDTTPLPSLVRRPDTPIVTWSVCPLPSRPDAGLTDSPDEALAVQAIVPPDTLSVTVPLDWPLVSL